MPNKTPQELREWYQKFSKALYEKVQIDVTRKEDLGRVRNFKIISQDVDEPLDIETEMTYAYMPHDGTKYNVPAPEIGDFPKYAKWMTENLNPNVTDAEIQKLYNQSRDGTLMVIKPGGSLSNIQMVLTDNEGNITVSVPANAYIDKSVPIPVGQEVPDAPELVKVPTPEKFGCPQPPIPPKNLEPNWLSRLGHYLGFNTDYTKLLRFQEESASYPGRLEAWQKDPKGLASFNQAVLDRQAYEEEVIAFQADPYCRLCAIQNGIVSQIMNMDVKQNTKFMDHIDQERDYLKARHDTTPLGKMTAELKLLEDRISYFKETEQALYDLTGHDPHPENLPNHKAFELEQVKAFYKPEKYELPPIPDSDFLTAEQEQALVENWEELAAVAGFAATSDYEILGSEQLPGFSREETADLKYGMVLPNLFMEFRSNINHELTCVEPARKLAKEALYAYSEGKPQQLGEILARSLRQTSREAAGLNKIAHSSTWRNLYLVSKLVETLDKHPDVLSASGLTQEEMEEARGFAALYKVITKGAEARKALLEHAVGKKTLSPGELEQVGKDALFASHIFYQVCASYNEQTQTLEDSPVYKQVLADLEYNSQHLHVQKQADEAKAQGMEVADVLYQTAKEMENQAAIARKKFTLLEFNRTGAPINKNLLNENWVDAAKNQLAKNVDLTKILSSGKSITDAFHSEFDLAMATKDLVLEAKSAQKEKSLELEQPQLQAAQNNVATM